MDKTHVPLEFVPSDSLLCLLNFPSSWKTKGNGSKGYSHDCPCFPSCKIFLVNGTQLHSSHYCIWVTVWFLPMKHSNLVKMYWPLSCLFKNLYWVLPHMPDTVVSGRGTVIAPSVSLHCSIRNCGKCWRYRGGSCPKGTWVENAMFS